MMIEYGAEKDLRLLRDDTETPVRRGNTERSVECSPAASGIFQQEYSIIIISRFFADNMKVV